MMAAQCSGATRGPARNRSCAAGQRPHLAAGRDSGAGSYPVVGNVGAGGTRSRSVVFKRREDSKFAYNGADCDPGNFWGWAKEEPSLRRPSPVKARQPAQDNGPRSPRVSTASTGTTDEVIARRYQRIYDREVQEKEARTLFKCPFCLDETTFDDSVELDCGHRVCRDCIFRHVEIKIKEKRVKEEEMACPMPGCGREITVAQVEGLTKGTNLWDRFLETRVELWKPKEKSDQLCVCPKSGCGGRFLAPAGTREVKCIHCKTPFCPRCQNHHPGSTCEKYAAWRKENDQGERAFLELMQQEGWQQCPRCKVACAKDRGCMYMTCYSETCRGSTHFCYVCGVELSMLQHYTHFPHGLFENACENMDKREEARQRKERHQREHPRQAQNWWDEMVGGMTNWVFGGN